MKTHQPHAFVKTQSPPPQGRIIYGQPQILQQNKAAPPPIIKVTPPSGHTHIIQQQPIPQRVNYQAGGVPTNQVYMNQLPIIQGDQRIRSQSAQQHKIIHTNQQLQPVIKSRHALHHQQQSKHHHHYLKEEILPQKSQVLQSSTIIHTHSRSISPPVIRNTITQIPPPQIIRNTTHIPQTSILLSPARSSTQQRIVRSTKTEQSFIPVQKSIIIPTTTIQPIVQSISPVSTNTFQKIVEVEKSGRITNTQKIIEKPVYYEKEIEKIVEKPVYYEKVVEKPVYVNGQQQKEEVDNSKFLNKIEILERENKDLHERLSEHRQHHLTLINQLDEYKMKYYELQNSPPRIEYIENVIEKPVYHERIVQIDRPSERIIHYDHKEEILQLQSDHNTLKKKYEQAQERVVLSNAEIQRINSKNSQVQDLEHKIIMLTTQLELANQKLIMQLERGKQRDDYSPNITNETYSSTVRNSQQQNQPFHFSNNQSQVMSKHISNQYSDHKNHYYDIQDQQQKHQHTEIQKEQNASPYSQIYEIQQSSVRSFNGNNQSINSIGSKRKVSKDNQDNNSFKNYRTVQQN